MNSNGFGIGLGVGMLLGYRSGFLARPYSNTHGYNTYEDIHRSSSSHVFTNSERFLFANFFCFVSLQDTGSPPPTLFFETLTKPCKQKTVLLE